MSSTERIRSARESKFESVSQLGSEINFSALAITSLRTSLPVFLASVDKEEILIIELGESDTTGSVMGSLSAGSLSLTTPGRCWFMLVLLPSMGSIGILISLNCARSIAFATT